MAAALVAMSTIACDPADALEAEELDLLAADELDLVDAEEFEDGAEFEPVVGVIDELDEDDAEFGPEDDDEDEGPADALIVEQDPLEIGTAGTYSWGTPGNNGAPLDLGPDHNRTCFLTGVTGELEGSWQGTRASVDVYRSGGHWWLQTKAGTGGSGVMGHAACINAAANRRTISWVGNSINGPNTMYSWVEDTGFTKCFLTSVTGSVGWASPNSYARLQKKTIYGFGAPVPGWQLSGNLLTEQDGTSGGSAAAVCVDLWFQSSTPYDLASYGATQWITPSADTVCGVERIAGNLASAPGGWWDGVRAFLDYGVGWWKVTTNDGKRISGTCYDDIQWIF